jgi:hypothetical protein
MSAVLPINLPHIDKAKIGLVDESRGLESVPGAFCSHVSMCGHTELFVDERYQLLQCRFIPLSPSS